MKISFIKTHNVTHLVNSITALQNRDPQVPGLGLIHGRAGLGKTEALQWYAVHHEAIYVRAVAAWTTNWMLQDFCRELQIFPFSRTQKNYEQVLTALEGCNYPLIIDEADYLLRDSRMLDTVRDLHDITKTPIILVGMEEICSKLVRHRQFWSRISQIVEFASLAAPEIMVLAKEWAGLQIEPEAAELLCKHTEGDFRHITVALYHLEQAANTNKTKTITASMVEAVINKVIRRNKKAGRPASAQRQLS